MRPARWALVSAAIAGSCACAAGSTPAAVTPDPGGAGAWGTGLSLLADLPGPLVGFDQPAGLAGERAPGERAPGEGGLSDGPPRLALAVARARLFELDALSRTRVALGVRASTWGGALGLESFGPREARRTRLIAACAMRLEPVDLGASWSEWRTAAGPSAHGDRAGALDLGLRARGPGGLAAGLALRGIASGGHVAARPDPDWSIETAWITRGASAFLAVTRDLAGSRAGGGLSLGAGPLSVRAGAFGAPWSWSLAILAGGRIAAAARVQAGYARVTHPMLGLSEIWEGGIEW